MSFPLANLSRRMRRVMWIGMAALMVAVVVTTNIYRRDARAKLLQAEITAHGGDCRFADPVYQWVLYWLGRDFRPMPTDVSLGGGYFRSTWLEANEHLADLRIDRLTIWHCPITGDDIKAISERHSIRYLDASSLERADSAARGLWQAGEIEAVDLRYSDLTDDGLRQLPLARIRSLRIAGTRVTSHGLGELSRSSRLVELYLDGRQFDANVATALNSLPAFVGLQLEGEEVTDDHIRLLHSMPRVDSVIIEWTSATHKAITEYAKARPDSVIVVDDMDFPADF